MQSAKWPQAREGERMKKNESKSPSNGMFMICMYKVLVTKRK